MLEGEPRLLLVEDDRQIQEFLTDALRDEGYDVRLAVNGRQALEALRDWRPHLILLDLRMPDMDGWAFREAQLAEGLAADVPVIVLTAAHTLTEGAERLAAVAVIQKPFDLDALLAEVRRHCRAD